MATRTKYIVIIALTLILLNLTFPPRLSNEGGGSVSRGFIFSDTSIVSNSLFDLIKGFSTTYYYTASINSSVLYAQCLIILVISALLIIYPTQGNNK
jgi:hypothetical protein